MENLQELAVLTRIREELESALRATLTPESMSIVERHGENIRKIALLQNEADGNAECQKRLKEQEEILKELPPAHLFIGVDSARDAIRAYLIWAKKATEEAKITEALFFHEWRRTSDGHTKESLQKTVHASVSANSTTRREAAGRRNNKAFYRDNDNEKIVGLAEWLEPEPVTSNSND